MKKFALKVALALFLVALYFASDFYGKGKLLNEALPLPVLGYAFWILLAAAIFFVLLKPILDFSTLVSAGEMDEDARILKISKYIRRRLKKDESFGDLRSRLNSELIDRNPSVENLKALVDEYFGALDRENLKIIKNYSAKAALCVVFSRNQIADAVLMFLSQQKMVMELLRRYGYRTSPLFNLLCLFWIASNSALVGVYSQASAENVGDILGTFLSEQGVENALLNRGLSKLGAFAVEAVSAFATVYVTGLVINRKLQGNRKKVELKELFALRTQAKKALLTDFSEGLKEKLAKVAGEE